MACPQTSGCRPGNWHAHCESTIEANGLEPLASTATGVISLQVLSLELLDLADRLQVRLAAHRNHVHFLYSPNTTQLALNRDQTIGNCLCLSHLSRDNGGGLLERLVVLDGLLAKHIAHCTHIECERERG